MQQEEIERRVALADEYHDRGFNCAQSTALACCDLVGLDEREAFRMLEGFGGGMGGTTETCGAISGGVAVIGYKISEGPHNPTTKKRTYPQAHRLVAEFRAKNGSTLCNEIKGLTGGPVLRSCPGCIEDAVRLTLAILDE